MMKKTLSNKAYDVLKFLTTIFLPAIGALYFGLAKIWGLPMGSEVVATISVITVFLGVVLGLSSASYNASTPRTELEQLEQK